MDKFPSHRWLWTGVAMFGPSRKRMLRPRRDATRQPGTATERKRVEP